MSRYTLDEDAVIRLMYEDGEDWKDIADVSQNLRLPHLHTHSDPLPDVKEAQGRSSNPV